MTCYGHVFTSSSLVRTSSTVRMKTIFLLFSFDYYRIVPIFIVNFFFNSILAPAYFFFHFILSLCFSISSISFFFDVSSNIANYQGKSTNSQDAFLRYSQNKISIEKKNKYNGLDLLSIKYIFNIDYLIHLFNKKFTYEQNHLSIHLFSYQKNCYYQTAR